MTDANDLQISRNYKLFKLDGDISRAGKSTN